MNAAELSELDVAALSVDELEQAMRAALEDRRPRTGRRVRPGRRAQAARVRSRPTATRSTPPPSPAHRHRATSTRRWNWPSRARRTTPSTTAANRAVEFGLKKAQLFVKMKDADRAVAAFDALDRQAPRRREVLHHRGRGDAAAQERFQGRVLRREGLGESQGSTQRRPGRALPGIARRREAGVGNGRPTTSWESAVSAAGNGIVWPHR